VRPSSRLLDFKHINSSSQASDGSSIFEENLHMVTALGGRAAAAVTILSAPIEIPHTGEAAYV